MSWGGVAARQMEQYGPCLDCARDLPLTLVDPRTGQRAGMYYEAYHLPASYEAVYRLGGKRALMLMILEGKVQACRGKRYGR